MKKNVDFECSTWNMSRISFLPNKKDYSLCCTRFSLLLKILVKKNNKCPKVHKSQKHLLFYIKKYVHIFSFMCTNLRFSTVYCYNETPMAQVVLYPELLCYYFSLPQILGNAQWKVDLNRAFSNLFLAPCLQKVEQAQVGKLPLPPSSLGDTWLNLSKYLPIN
jgi:hypothetical protein